MRKTKVVFAVAVLLCSVLSADLVGAQSPLISERRIIGQSIEGRALEAFRRVRALRANYAAHIRVRRAYRLSG